VGGFFGLRAMSKKSDSEVGGACDSNNVCSTPEGLDAREQAVSAGGISTIAFVAGGVLVAGGVTLYLVGGPAKREKVGRVMAAPVALPGGGGLSMIGNF